MNKTDLKTLMDSLTLDEKIGQLVQLSGEFFQGQELSIGPSSKLGINQDQINNVGSVLNVSGAEMTRKIQEKHLETSRHKIPLIFMGDLVYGFKTVLPSPMGIGSTWNRGLVESAYKMIANEGSASGVHVTFSPMVDLVRDPRWGRVLESTGEDVYLNGEYARAMVKGFQNDFEPGTSMAACVKHFAAYGAGEGGRDYNTVDMSRWRLMTDQLPAYKAAIDAGSKLVMTSFNTIEGVPATGNKWLMKDLLRDEWGFEGVVISDYAAVFELIPHGVAKDEKEATKMALEATVDIDMKTSCYVNNTKELIESGELDIQVLDDSVWRVLCLKNELGLFEDPYREASIEREKAQVLTQENLDVSKQIADESIVLLKNEGILPLDKDSKVALVGPFADSRLVTGMWAINADYASVVTLKQGVEKNFTNVIHSDEIEIKEDLEEFGAMGKMLLSQFKKDKPESEVSIFDTEEFEDRDVIVLTLGEHILSSGEGGSRTNLDLENHQMELFRKAKQTGKPVVTIIYSGRPLIVDEVVKESDAVIWAWYPGSRGGDAVAEILNGTTNPSGRLSMSFPINVGQIPVYYNHFATGRPFGSTSHSERFVSRYLDTPNEPLFAFGEGLSYHQSEIKNVKLDKESYKIGDSIEITLDLINHSDRDGQDTIQVYVKDHVGSVVRPVKQLVNFEKVAISANETKSISITLDQDAFSMINAQLETVIEPGEFTIYVGFDSKVEEGITIEMN